jgi:hypothetical protein
MNVFLKREGIRRGLILATLMAVALSAGALQAAKGDNNGKGNDKDGGGGVAATTYSGQAVALRIDDVAVPVPGPIIVADTGLLPATGGLIQRSQSDFNLGNGALTIALATAMTSGSGPQAESETTLNDLHIEIITPANGSVVINASYIAASVTASVEPGGKTNVSGSVTIQGLTVNGNAVNVTGQSNQIVNIPGGRIVIDERANTATNSTGDIALKAIHFYIDNCMNGAAGVVAAGISSSGNVPPPQAGDCGKLTGGGWILSSTGDKCTFGVSGGIRRDEFWGQLNYIDHGTGMHVKSTAVTAFGPNPAVPDCRTIVYDVTIDGVAGTATVDAWDRGEPGRNDFFSIRLSNGYSAKGTLGGDAPGGGNLQLHKCPPGWE